MAKQRRPYTPAKQVGLNAIRQRMRYLCEHQFGGNVPVFARQLGVRTDRMRDMLEGEHSFQFPVLMRVVQRGLLNAEWLLCGTGPVAPDMSAERDPPIALPHELTSTHSRLNTVEVQYETARTPAQPTIADVPYDEVALLRARAIHSARSHKRPVVLFIGHAPLAANAGPVVCEMLRKGYVTGVALSSAAALRDLERALFGGRASLSDRLIELGSLNRTALLGAQSGMGYGEALGRWAFPPESQRAESVLATAYELSVPCTVHLALGDSMPHFFPAPHAAELGAALGAASYVDMLIFADEVRQMAGRPSGVFMTADGGDHGTRLFSNALAAVESNDRARGGGDATWMEISGEFRLTFPALLRACDAVYDGSADDVRRMRRK